MNFDDFHFIRPYWLLALLPAAALIVMLLRNKLSRGNWSAVCDAALLPYLLQEKAAGTRRMPLLLGGIMAVLAIVALAGPTWQRLPSPVFRNDSALVIALDLSRSMDAEDVKPSRLVRARYKIADLLRLRKDGQTALLVYAGAAFTVTPLTDDSDTITSQLEALTTDIMPEQGSRPEAALQLAVQLLQQAGLPKGEILLMTDGVEGDAALQAAKGLQGYRLSVLGVGTQDGAPIALPSGGFLKDEQGAIVVPKLDTARLADLAAAGGGVYRTMAADDGDIAAILANLDASASATQDHGENQLLIDLWNDLGPWLVLAVLPLAALSFRRGLLCAAFIMLLPLPENSYALGWQDVWKTKDQQAAQAFEHKQYDKAAELFENPDWKAAAQYRLGKPQSGELPTPKTATGFYNQGNVLAKSGRFEEAVAAYGKALALDPGNEDAGYNKKLVEDALKQQKQQQQNQQQNDQQKSSENEQQDQQQDQNGSEQKPEQKDERPAENNAEAKSEKSEEDKKNAVQKAEEQQKQAEQQQTQEASEEPKKQDAPKSDDKLAQPFQPSDETTQANEQWLNRIPDDPGGLLKRKFKYQYSQRQPRSDDKAKNW